MMHAASRLFRWVFPQGEFWNRLAIGSVALIAGLIFFGGCAIIAVTIALSNTITNDTELDAFCRSSVGLPKRMIIGPGDQEDWIDTYGCGIYDRADGYVGCLLHDHQDEPVLVSSFTPDIAEADCDINRIGR